MNNKLLIPILALCTIAVHAKERNYTGKTAQQIARACQESDSWMEARIDVTGCDGSDIRSEEAIRSYARQLCALLNITHEAMINEPTISYYGGNKSTNGFLLMLATSQAHFTARFVNMSNAIYLTISSKKAFDPYAVAQATQKFFKARDCSTNVTLR
jgi:hypothetical protein